MLGYKDLADDTKTFIYYLKDLRFLEDTDAERYWNAIQILLNSEAQISLQNNSAASTINFAREVDSCMIKYVCDLILILYLFKHFFC